MLYPAVYMRNGRLAVSILIQPEGWMLSLTSITTAIASGFNPHPARRLDAIFCSSVKLSKEYVSILIQPEGWMLSEALDAPCVAKIVSILIQPEGWML